MILLKGLSQKQVFAINPLLFGREAYENRSQCLPVGGKL